MSDKPHQARPDGLVPSSLTEVIDGREALERTSIFVFSAPIHAIQCGPRRPWPSLRHSLYPVQPVPEGRLNDHAPLTIMDKPASLRSRIPVRVVVLTATPEPHNLA